MRSNLVGWYVAVIHQGVPDEGEGASEGGAIGVWEPSRHGWKKRFFRDPVF